MLQRSFPRYVFSAGADQDSQLHFMMHIGRNGRQHYLFMIENDGRRGFEEKNRSFWDIEIHLTGVFCIILPDTYNFSDCRTIADPPDRQQFHNKFNIEKRPSSFNVQCRAAAIRAGLRLLLTSHILFTIFFLPLIGLVRCRKNSYLTASFFTLSFDYYYGNV